MTAPISAMWPIVAANATSSAGVEDRPQQHVLRHVAAAAERVVVQHDVARLERLGAELVEHAAHRLADRAEVRRVEAALRDHPAARGRRARTRSRATR